jgi:DNA-binding transcriptional MerR regulator
LNKAPDAFRTISEVADELDLPQHVLRFWESRFPHIRPMKRGGGRRYYRPEDVDLLRGIRHLLYGDGYTIRGVQRILREQGVRTVQSVGQGHAVNLPVQSREDGRDDEVEAEREAAPQDARGIFRYLPRFSGGPPDMETDELREGSEQELEEDDEAEGPMSHIGAPIRPDMAAQKRPKLEANFVEGKSAGSNSVEARSAAERALPKTPGSAQVPEAPLAFVPPPAKGLAAEDVERLKHALGELEACRRLLDKAIEGGR